MIKQICTHIRPLSRRRCLNCCLYSTGAVNLRPYCIPYSKFLVTLFPYSINRSSKHSSNTNSLHDQQSRIQLNCMYTAQVTDHPTVQLYFGTAIYAMQYVVYIQTYCINCRSYNSLAAVQNCDLCSTLRSLTSKVLLDL